MFKLLISAFFPIISILIFLMLIRNLFQFFKQIKNEINKKENIEKLILIDEANKKIDGNQFYFFPIIIFLIYYTMGIFVNEIINHNYFATLDSKQVKYIKVGNKIVNKRSELEIIIESLNDTEWVITSGNHAKWGDLVDVEIIMGDGKSKIFKLANYKNKIILEMTPLFLIRVHIIFPKLRDVLNKYNIKLEKNELINPNNKRKK